ncbi:hypothetical protein D9758_009782 [Tetrapyrgos nigripes]|uniref:Alpha-type protein kinase domain-containing protein n=1 Tax=Tetrapyrgos nigripes TaxID=182062 RepID=A0A8H5GJS6_9AGAR|nr:hypothetical protein D9758_009782 [Tetrapyrgos nigripes]
MSSLYLLLQHYFQLPQAVVHSVVLPLDLFNNVKVVASPSQITVDGIKLWHTSSTPLDQVPEDIQFQFAVKESLKEISTTSKSGLPCTDEDCRTAKGKPRTRSQCCPNQRCASCCRRAFGGCTQHPINGQRSTALASDLSPSPSATASTSEISEPISESESNSAGSQTVIEPRRFARPLTEGWGQALASQHKRYETTRQLAEAETLANQEPHHVQVSSKHPKTLVVADQPLLIEVLSDPKSFVTVYAPKSHKWFSQEVTLPITHDGPCVLLRSYNLEDSDCLNLELEVVRLFGDSHSVLQRSASSALMPMSGSSSSGTPKALDPSTSSRRTFPRKYVVDMVAGLKKLDGLKGVVALKEAFIGAFEGCTFSSSTVYNALKVFRDARKLGLLDKYQAAARTDDGLWSKLVKETKESEGDGKLKSLKKEDSGTLESSTEESQSDDSDDGPDYQVWTVRISHIDYNQFVEYDEEQCLGAHYLLETDGIPLVLTFDNPTCGGIKRVCLGLAALNGKKTPLAVKFFGYKQAPNWWKICSPSLYLTLFTEATRLYQLREAQRAFVAKAEQVGMAITAFEVVETYLVELKTKPTEAEVVMIAQPWIYGQAVNPEELENDETFSAFTHFCYQYFNNERIDVHFQAIRDSGRIYIYDSLSHLILDRSSGKCNFIRSQGRIGIMEHVQKHTCRGKCEKLGLPSMVEA